MWRNAPLVAILSLLVAGCRPEPAPPDPEPPPAEPAEPMHEPTQVALTIDDLPWVGPLPPSETTLGATQRLLAALRRHDAHAVGFANCGRLRRDSPVLRAWLDAGMSIGNHTDQHLDLHRAPLDGWLRDARSCDRFLRDVTGDPFLFFRYPYLHEGHTPERWHAARDLLRELDSPVAHVTLDTSDWVIAGAYVRAIRHGDERRATEIADAFVEHVVRVLRHYEGVAGDRVGRPVRHIMLLHVNALVADHLDALLRRLAAEGVEFIPLEAALEDPVYRLPNDYFGPEGLSWLYRFEPAAPELAAWDAEQIALLRAAYGR
jgi:peptidoglycan-N-acetylglucosamine deacetylase